MENHRNRPPAAHDAEPFDPIAPTDAPANDTLADLPAFTPVPLRARSDGWTPERQLHYVAALAGGARMAAAARAVGMTEQSASRLRTRPGAESFARACTAAWRLGAPHRRAPQEQPAPAACPCCGRPLFPPLGSGTL